MRHPVPPGRPRALPGPARAPRAVRCAILAATVLVALAALTGAAGAACVCRCADGKAVPVCSSSTDIPPLCNQTTCTAKPPQVPPSSALKPKPPVKPGCTIRQVYNPDTKSYEWGQICH